MHSREYGDGAIERFTGRGALEAPEEGMHIEGRADEEASPGKMTGEEYSQDEDYGMDEDIEDSGGNAERGLRLRPDAQPSVQHGTPWEDGAPGARSGGRAPLAASLQLHDPSSLPVWSASEGAVEDVPSEEGGEAGWADFASALTSPPGSRSNIPRSPLPRARRWRRADAGKPSRRTRRDRAAWGRRTRGGASAA